MLHRDIYQLHVQQNKWTSPFSILLVAKSARKDNNNILKKKQQQDFISSCASCLLSVCGSTDLNFIILGMAIFF